MNHQNAEIISNVRCEIISTNSTQEAAQKTTLTAYHPRNHPLNCTYHVDQYPHECTCGLLGLPVSDNADYGLDVSELRYPMDNAPMQSEAASDVTLTDEDKIMADAAFDCAFRADTETIDRDMAELFARHRIAATRKHDPSALVDALGDALFSLSLRLKNSGFLDDDKNHAAYERVVSAWEATQ